MYKNLKMSLCILIFIILYPQITFAGKIDHSLYDLILKNNVKDGLVNYNNIKKNDIHLLNQYLEQFHNINVNDFEPWSKDEKLSFWINGYNAITIYGIVKNYPIKYGGLIARARFPRNSIRQIKDFWNTVFIRVIWKDITLNHIEHEILRKKFNEPRIHFALVCASKGCPELLNKAYKPNILDEQLENVTKSFINNRKIVFLDTSKNELHISSIFKWYAEDFPVDDSNGYLNNYNKNIRGVVQFIMKHFDSEKRNYIINNKPEIKYLDYDWSLNEMINSNSN
ncbi:MAG: DUF547 domain-containing protein [Candidatus Helarchaeota archaeon]|nr:DUF547 domain-containing protein [Candidatus Helarchaeota archaeon]